MGGIRPFYFVSKETEYETTSLPFQFKSRGHPPLSTRILYTFPDLRSPAHNFANPAARFQVFRLAMGT